MSIRWLLTILAIAAIAVRGGAQSSDRDKGDIILSRVDAVFTVVSDYTVNLEVNADLERLKVPRMKATMFFKRPDKVHFDSEGLALLPREGLALPFSNLRERFAVDSVFQESLEGVPVFRLVMHRKDERARNKKMILFVHRERWTPEKLLVPFGEGSFMTGDFHFTRIGDYWMPADLAIQFVVPERTESQPALPQAQQSPLADPQVQSGRAMPPRAGKVNVRYSNYQINTGLSDEVFRQEAK